MTLSTKPGFLLGFIDGMPPFWIVIGPRSEQDARLHNAQDSTGHNCTDLKSDSQVLKFKHLLIENFSLDCSILFSSSSASIQSPAIAGSPVVPSKRGQPGKCLDLMARGTAMK